MSSTTKWAVAALAFALAGPAAEAQEARPSPGNPVAPHIFAADPAPHVWPGDPDRLWIYTSHDHAGTNTHDTMSGYHAFSTTDLANWTDHGQVLSVDRVGWAIDMAWAIDAASYKGKYYLVFCMKEAKTGVFMTGLAVSDRPEGPFEDVGTIKGTEWGQDPALFVDEDGTPYLYWGHDYLMYAARLTADLKAIIPSTKVEITKQLASSYEAPWINKINGKYLMTYAAIPGRVWPERMFQAIADKPLGPFRDGSQFLDTFPLASATNHGGLVRFRDRWIYFYHSAWGSAGNPFVRSLMADFVTLTPDGRIQPFVPTSAGISGGKPVTSRIWLEAENGKAAGGDLVAVAVGNSLKGYSGRGYVSGFPVADAHSGAFYTMREACRNCITRASPGQVKVLAQVAHTQRYTLKLRYGADDRTRVVVTVGKRQLRGPASERGDIHLPATGREFGVAEIGTVTLAAGDNLIQLQTRDQKDLRVDAFELVPVYE